MATNGGARGFVVIQYGGQGRRQSVFGVFLKIKGLHCTALRRADLLNPVRCSTQYAKKYIVHWPSKEVPVQVTSQDPQGNI